MNHETDLPAYFQPIRRLQVLAIAVASLLPLVTAQAEQGFVSCPPVGQPLLTVPEIVRDPAAHRLKGVLKVSDESRLLWFGGSQPYCASQYMRYFEIADPPKTSGLPEPMPGPTLRARVGDTVELTFLNQINPQDFGQSIDRGEQGLGCDQTSVYPGNTGDIFPDCFHGSSTANVHFHGTHTSPSTTADNVLIEVRPSPRNKDGKPDINEATFAEDFDAFFQQCEKQLDMDEVSTLPVAWPTRWSQLPPVYRLAQQTLLQQYDETAPFQGKNGLPPDQQLWPQNQLAIESLIWPQYYIGAFPYCFKLPAYREATWPPANPKALQMGQAPGTHWYHAHKHGSTEINVSNGMAGVFIIEGDYDDKLRHFYADKLNEKVLVIQQLGVTPNLERGSRGQADLSINGRRQPVLTMRPGETQLWRVANTAAHSGVYLFASTDLQWRQTAQDGVQLAPSNYAVQKGSLPQFLAGGNRVDLLVQAPMQEGDFQVMASTTVNPSPPPAPNKGKTLFTVRVKNDGSSPETAMGFPGEKDFPPLPVFLKDIADTEIRIRRELTFTTEGGRANPTSRHVIDGKKFSDTISQAMLQGTAEEWKIVNETVGIAHPFHIHINPFQIVEVFDPNTMTEPQKLAPPFVWWDVFSIPAAKKDGNKLIPGYFKMRSRFEDYSGQFVLHCHILAHEDRGMMQLIEVVPNHTLLKHH